MVKGMGSGWHFESARHSLASRGIHTGTRVNPSVLMGTPTRQKWNHFFVLQGAYGHGWEDLTAEDSRAEIRQRLKEYRENEGGNYRIVQKKELRDTDRDGVPDAMDCAPNDPHRQHAITRYSGDLSASAMAEELKHQLAEEGYDGDIRAEGNRIIMRQIRLSDRYIDEKGYNISPYTNRRGRILGWDNWVEVNNTLNKVLDQHHASANIKSLGGKFKIREGTKAFTEEDWDNEGESNVGSMIAPIPRREAWVSEGVPRRPSMRERTDQILRPRPQQQATTFGTMDNSGRMTNSMSINLGQVNSPDPLAFSYGFSQGKFGQPKAREKGLAPEYLRGYKLGRQEFLASKKSTPKPEPKKEWYE